jgi:hypothetical protein
MKAPGPHTYYFTRVDNHKIMHEKLDNWWYLIQSTQAMYGNRSNIYIHIYMYIDVSH